MTLPKMILQVVFLFCLLSSAFSFPYIPDAEDDINENEINAGKFEDIDGNFDKFWDEDMFEYDEDIAHDEEILEVHPEKDDDDEEEKVLDAEEKDIVEEKHEIAKDEEELDEEKAIIEEKHEIAKDEEGLDEEEKVIIDEDKKFSEDEDEEKVPDPFKDDDDDDKDESGEHFGGFDEEDVHKPHFFAHMYNRAKEFLKGLGK